MIEVGSPTADSATSKTSTADSFPRQHARTRRFTLGAPRDVVVSPDGRRVVFARSASGADPVHSLFVHDLQTGIEQRVADPAVLLAIDGPDVSDATELPPEERARRERAREMASGIVSYATDPEVRVAAFALAGRLFVAGLISARARELTVQGPVFDPRPDPTAQRVAYVCGSTLRVAELDGSSCQLAGESDENVSWGSADFIAAEEMNRSRGYWWAPDGQRLAVARVDTSPVATWYLADPTEPAAAPRAIRYPAAGTANAEVTLHVIGLDGTQIALRWDRDAFPYLADVRWNDHGLHVVVQSRDQRRLAVLRADETTGATSAVHVDEDDTWVELVRGVPAWLSDGRMVTCADRDGVRRLFVEGVAVTPTVLQVRAVHRVAGASIVFSANDIDEPSDVHVWRWDAGRGLAPLTTDQGVHAAAVGGPDASTVVLTSASLKEGPKTYVLGGPTLTSSVEVPVLEPNVTLARVGARRLPAALALPSNHRPGDKLPVLLDPYGGPHSQRVVRSRNAHLSSQWFADQGFAVVVIDGRGTPGLGTQWERAVHHDLATAVLEDQIDGLHALAGTHPELDLERVAIRGWSFGGYLAALAVLRRPDVFHAAVAGAPVTDWRLYDTHYTERYLGDPTSAAGADAYERSSLLPLARDLARPLLLIHGLADDNVVAAHTLQLSRSLTEAGRPHTVLPLPGVSHMTPQEEVAENLLLLQLAFLRQALKLDA